MEVLMVKSKRRKWKLKEKQNIFPKVWKGETIAKTNFQESLLRLQQEQLERPENAEKRNQEFVK